VIGEFFKNSLFLDFETSDEFGSFENLFFIFVNKLFEDIRVGQ
jgi:hypothetical protein